MAKKEQQNGLKELWIDELRDLYDAENRLVKALPKMAKAANSEDLRAGFESHLEQTKGHVERLEEIFEALEQNPTGKQCPAMAGLVKEGSETMDEDFEGAVMDAALIASAQRVEHYEIAAYGCVSTWAELLGENDAAALLQKTLEEEKETDEKLSELSETINTEAKNFGTESEEKGGTREEDAPRKTRTARA